MKYIQSLLNLPVFPHLQATKTCNFMAWLFSLVAVSSVIGFMPVSIGHFYIPVCGLCLLYILSARIDKVNVLYIFMFVAFGISALASTEPVFRSKLRYLLYILVMLISSPCIVSKRSIIFRTLVSRNILVLLILMSISSFFCYFLGINYGRNVSGKIVNTIYAGSFGGLFVNSMVLGPLSVLVAMIFLNSYLVVKNKIFIILFFLASSSVLLSASRGATLSLVTPILFLFFVMGGSNRDRKKLIKLLFVAFILFIPLAGKMMTGLREKQSNNIEAGGTFSSRESKWKNRIAEFRDSPIIGVGFSAVSIQNVDDYNSSGGLEPGSSHLAVLSMTGILGFVLYVLVLFSAYKTIKYENSGIARMRLSILLAFITHATFEGYALAAGGFLCLMYWISIGQCEDFPKMAEYGLIEEDGNIYTV